MRKLALSVIGMCSLVSVANAKTVAQIDREVSHCGDNERETGMAGYWACIDESGDEYKKLVKTTKQKKIYAQEQKKCYAKYGSQSVSFGENENESEADYGNRLDCYMNAAKVAAKTK